MQSTLNPAHGDPCDVLEIAPDIVLVARAEEELSKLARDVKTRASAPPQPKAGPTLIEDFSVPPIDTAFRATAVNRMRPSGGLKSMRRFVGVLLAVFLGIAVLTLKVSGDVAQKLFATWIPEFASRSDPPESPAPQEQSAATAQPAATAAAVLPPVQPADATTQNGVQPAAAPDQAQMLQSMAHHLANLRQQVEELKGQLAEMKASQEQMSRDIDKTAEQKAMKLSALPPRTAPSRRPQPTFRAAQSAAAPVAPPPPTAYVPPPPAAPYGAPQATTAPPAAASAYPPPPFDPNVPRPPLPVRE